MYTASMQSNIFLLYSIRFILFQDFPPVLICSVEEAKHNSVFITSPHVSVESPCIDAVIVMYTFLKTKQYIQSDRSVSKPVQLSFT